MGRAVWAGLIALVLVGCRSPRNEVLPTRDPLLIGEGLASYYAPSLQGRLTANGERFDNHQLTAAHRTLAFGTCVVVQNVVNGASVPVRVNDRGPFVAGRIIDLSESAARQLGFLKSGVARVRLYRCS
jgi:rare lipoprotein A